MNLEKEINNKGFVFAKIEMDENFKTKVLHSTEPNIEIKDFFLKSLKKIDSKIKDIHCVYEDIQEGMFHEMHTHLTPSRYQVVVWFPKEDYSGREFIYGKRDSLNTFKPSFKDMCFMKTNDLNFIHGVAPLKTNTLVRTLLISVDHATNLGEHLTVSAKDFRGI